MSREQFIQSKLQLILHELSGLEIEDIDVAETFLDMGFDSLFLTQANLRFKKEFKVKITFRQLFDVAPTVAALASYIDQQLPDDAFADELQPVESDPAPAPTASAAGTAPTATAALTTGANASALQQAVALQLQANSALLQALQAGQPATLSAPPVPESTTASPATDVPPTIGSDFKPTVSLPAATGRFGPFKEFNKSLNDELSNDQQAYLEGFIKRYEAKTAKSKAYTQEHRAHYADPRAVSGFKQVWKEITYPIVGERSKGAKVWDVDGNEYIDCAGGFGATLFGHAPDFLLEAVTDQLSKSVDYGPQSLLAGPTAKLICELTGMDRASFCNTGSEAVLAAMRIARTVTGNDLIVSFAGSYHGIFDEVLVRPQDIGVHARTSLLRQVYRAAQTKTW